MQSNELGFMIDLHDVVLHSTIVFKRLTELGYTFNCPPSKEVLLNQSLDRSGHTVMFLLPGNRYIGWVGDYVSDINYSSRYFYQNAYSYLVLSPFEFLRFLRCNNISRQTLDTLFGKELHRRIKYDKNSDNYRFVYPPAPSLDF